MDKNRQNNILIRLSRLSITRTLLSYIRTALLIVSLGLGLSNYDGVPFRIITAISIILATLAFSFGSYHCFSKRRLLSNMDREDKRGGDIYHNDYISAVVDTPLLELHMPTSVGYIEKLA